METLKFLMVTSHYPPRHLGGDAVFVKYLASELVRHGHEVDVLMAPGTYALLGRPDKEVDKTGVSGGSTHEFTTALPKVSALNALVTGSQSRASRKVLETAKSLRADVVHWHNTKGFIGRPFEVNGTRTLYTAHDYYTICPRSNLIRPNLSVCGGPYNCLSCHLRWQKPPPLWRMGRGRVVTLDRGVDVISPSTSLARRLSEAGLKVSAVIRNFVPRPLVRATPGRVRDHTVLYVGMLEQHKGVMTLIKGFAEARTRHNFRLRIIGDGSMKGTLTRLIANLGLGDRIQLAGFVSRDYLDGIRARSAFQIIPSEWPENSPLTAIEALSFGLPIIVSDQGGLPEIWSDEGRFEFKGSDRQALGDCLARAWESIEDLEHLSTKARDRYERLFTPEKHLKDYFSLIDGLSSG